MGRMCCHEPHETIEVVKHHFASIRARDEWLDDRANGYVSRTGTDTPGEFIVKGGRLYVRLEEVVFVPSSLAELRAVAITHLNTIISTMTALHLWWVENEPQADEVLLPGREVYPWQESFDEEIEKVRAWRDELVSRQPE